MEPRYPFIPDWAVAPGETLRECLAIQFARRSGLSVECVMGILDGREPITEPIAEAMEAATGVPAALWIEMERRYRQKLEYGE